MSLRTESPDLHSHEQVCHQWSIISVTVFLERRIAVEFFKCHFGQTKFLRAPLYRGLTLLFSLTHTHIPKPQLIQPTARPAQIEKYYSPEDVTKLLDFITCRHKQLNETRGWINVPIIFFLFFFSVRFSFVFRLSVWEQCVLSVLPSRLFKPNSPPLPVLLLMNFHPDSFLSGITELLCAGCIKHKST